MIMVDMVMMTNRSTNNNNNNYNANFMVFLFHVWNYGEILLTQKPLLSER